MTLNERTKDGRITSGEALRAPLDLVQVCFDEGNTSRK